MDKTQLEKISDYINTKYNLDTWVNEETMRISVSVWNKELQDSYDIEMSKGQIQDFNDELVYQMEVKKRKRLLRQKKEKKELENAYIINEYELADSGNLKLFRNGVLWNTYYDVDSISQAKILIADENKKLGYE